MRTRAAALRTGGVTLQCHAVTAVASASSRSGPPWHTRKLALPSRLSFVFWIIERAQAPLWGTRAWRVCPAGFSPSTQPGFLKKEPSVMPARRLCMASVKSVSDKQKQVSFTKRPARRSQVLTRLRTLLVPRVAPQATFCVQRAPASALQQTQDEVASLQLRALCAAHDARRPRTTPRTHQSHLCRVHVISYQNKLKT